MKQANGLRNRIVHNYNGLNEEIAFKSIQKHLEHLDKYKEDIDNWLQKNE